MNNLNIPITGDHNYLTIWIVIFVVAFIAAILAIVLYFMKNKNN